MRDTFVEPEYVTFNSTLVPVNSHVLMAGVLTGQQVGIINEHNFNFKALWQHCSLIRKEK